MNPIHTMYYEKLAVMIFQSTTHLAEAAALSLEKILCSAIQENGEAAVVLSTGNSQLAFFDAVVSTKNIEWGKIDIFHLDEYCGMPETHPASFRRYIRSHLINNVHVRSFFDIKGDARDIGSELARYAALLERHIPDVCVLGIGENGHLAFNDPPADFESKLWVHVVTLDERSRWQQVGEGHFQSFEDVPRFAISLTIPALLRAKNLLVVVPEKRKAPAVQRALEGPITPECPASILRTQPQARLFLDVDSASMLKLAS